VFLKVANLRIDFVEIAFEHVLKLQFMCLQVRILITARPMPMQAIANITLASDFHPPLVSLTSASIHFNFFVSTESLSEVGEHSILQFYEVLLGGIAVA